MKITVAIKPIKPLLPNVFIKSIRLGRTFVMYGMLGKKTLR